MIKNPDQATQPQEIGKLDFNMALPVAGEDGIVYHAPSEEPFRVGGFAWFEREGCFRRLPASPAFPVPEAVDVLANHTAGGEVAFRSNTTRVLIRVRLADNGIMYHMAGTGSKGFDLYLGGPGDRKFYAVSQFAPEAAAYTASLYEAPGGHWREFTLHFPLYKGVRELMIGLDEGAEIAPPAPRADERRIVVYGGSSVQGACASRPGRYHLSIVSRALETEVINLGFSGSGRLEPELAHLMLEIERPAVFVLEAERNTGYERVRERLAPFIEILKRGRPEVPVVVMSANPRAGEIFGDDRDRRKILAFMRETVAAMAGMGVSLFDSSELLGEDYYECTVDGVHPTDLGFSRMAAGLAPYLKKIIN